MLVLVLVFSAIMGSSALAFNANEESIMPQAKRYIQIERYYNHIPPLYIDYCDMGWGGRLNRYYYGYDDGTGLYKGFYGGYITDMGCPYSIVLELE